MLIIFININNYLVLVHLFGVSCIFVYRCSNLSTQLATMPNYIDLVLILMAAFHLSIQLESRPSTMEMPLCYCHRLLSPLKGLHRDLLNFFIFITLSYFLAFCFDTLNLELSNPEILNTLFSFLAFKHREVLIYPS